MALTGLVVCLLVVSISGYMIKVPTVTIQESTTLVQWLQRQKLILPLFENVCDESSNPVIRSLALNFKMVPEEYKNPEVINTLQSRINSGLLPKGEIFTEYNVEHMNELRVVYEVLSNARDFDIFMNAAAWARQNLNCALFVDAIYLAMLKRHDTSTLSIPAPYEIVPNYFLRKDVLITATSILQGQSITTEGVSIEGNTYKIDANYTALFYDNVDESQLAYFREDVGLNSYYFFKKLSLSPWFNKELNNNYGEELYFLMKQLSSRYDLERFANGLPEVDGIDWNSVIDVPYDPMLIYTNGKEFSHRSGPMQLPISESLELLKTIENNTSSLVSHLRQAGYNKTQILNHLMEILVTGERSYETLARQFLGKDLTNNGYKSILDHYMTSLRDPIFWKINKKIVELIDNALSFLPSYTRNELYFPGVEVVSVDVKKPMTMYDYFSFDVTDALKIYDNFTNCIKIGQPRLNHKPLAIKINITSYFSRKGLAKVFIGPGTGVINPSKNPFTLIDKFEVNLKPGVNLFTRSLDKTGHFANDFISIPTIRRMIEDAEYGLNSMSNRTIYEQMGYPDRLVLPKGIAEGLDYQLFVFVAPLVKTSVDKSIYAKNIEINTAILSPRYPLDLPIDNTDMHALPNAFYKVITITQKGGSKVENYGGPGASKKWSSNSDSEYDPSSRPSYSYQGKKPYDYNSKPYEYSTYKKWEKPNENNVYVNDKTKNEAVVAKFNEQQIENDSYSEENALDPKYYSTDNNAEATNNIPHLLKSTLTDKPKTKVPFNYKAKKAEFEQTRKESKNYPKGNVETTTKKEINNDIEPLSDTQDDIPSFSKMVEINKKIPIYNKKHSESESDEETTYEESNERETNTVFYEPRVYTDFTNVQKDYYVTDHENLMLYDEVQIKATTKRTPTVYDYLFNLDYEDLLYPKLYE